MIDKLAELAGRFRSRAADQAAALEQALEDGNDKVLAEHAHKLAGSAALFGFRDLGELAAEVERLIGTADRASARTHAAELAARLRSLAYTVG